MKKIRDTVEVEFDNFAKRDPELIQTMNVSSEIGTRLNTDLVNALATYEYIQKAKGKPAEVREAYDKLATQFATLAVNMSSHCVMLQQLIMFLIHNADELYSGYSARKGSFKKYLCQYKAQGKMRG